MRSVVRRLVATSCVALVPLAVGATPAGAEAVSVREYVEVLCTSLGDLGTAISEGREAAQESIAGSDSVADRKTAYVTFIDDSIAAAKKAVSELKSAGDPDVDDGAAIARTIRKAFAGITKAITSVRDDAAELPTTSVEQFRAGVERIQAKLTKASNRFGKQFDAAEKKYPVDELDEAYNDEPACSAVS